MFFKKTAIPRETPKKRFIDSTIEISKESWFEVFSACLGKSMANQKACSEFVVKGQNWNVDFSKGVISFGKNEFPVQFIGSESKSSNTWLWGWDNVNNFSNDILKIADEAKEIGSTWNLEPFTTPKFEITETFNGHAISIVATSVCKENVCYYKGPHDGGAIFVAFHKIPDKVFAPVDAPAFTSVTMQCIQTYYVDHPIFVKSFLYQNNTAYEQQGNSIIAHFKQDLKIDFERVDEFFRISNMKTI